VANDAIPIWVHGENLPGARAFDAVHAHEPFMPCCRSVHLLFAAPVVATFHAARGHGIDAYTGSSSPWLPRINGRIAHSRAALKLIGKYFTGRYRIIPSGIDYPFFAAEVPPMPKLMDGKRNILFVGRQEPRKGLPYLLEACTARQDAQTLVVVVG
jgi:phosphatidylinositol alpha-mannosyltransferase